MATIDYTQFTDIFEVAKDAATLREYPEPDAKPVATLKRGQRVARIDTFYWNGAWMQVFADVPADKKYTGYLRAEDVTESAADAAAQPAPSPTPSPSPPPAAQPTAPPPVAQQPPPPAAPQQPAPQPAPHPAPVPSGQVSASARTLKLGCFDANVSEQTCAAFLTLVANTTGAAADAVPATVSDARTGHSAKLLDKITLERVTAPADGLMSVADIQQALKTVGVFPGGKVDGIYGYRTRAAVRLFQEYVRAIEKQDSKAIPTGVFDASTQTHLQRWVSAGQRPAWNQREGEYEAWLALLDAAKRKYAAQPTRDLALVNADTRSSATRKVANWEVGGSDHIHLLGFRRPEFRDRFEEVFVLLMKGLVFKFQGTTQTAHVEKEHRKEGQAFLVHGQHDYNFGWHALRRANKKPYLALCPKGQGVLIVRGGDDGKLQESDYDRGLEVNATIHIHWGGPGMTTAVGEWSSGCQVIAGSVYIAPSDELVSCVGFAATSSWDAMTNPQTTRGAYNLISDLVTAYGSDLHDQTVKYTLLPDSDIDSVPALRNAADDARKRALDEIHRPR